MFYDIENNQKYWLDTSSKKVLLKIKDSYNKNVKYFRNSFLKSGADFFDLESDEPYINKLLTFFKNR